MSNRGVIMSTYKIGSFNIQKFNFRSEEDKNKNYDNIAKIIKENEFDVIAIQEALTPNAIEKLVKTLGQAYWDYRWAQPKSCSSNAREGYAFIWKKKRLNLIDSNSNPEILNRYDFKRSNKLTDNNLIRAPFVIRLTPQGLPGGCNFEFRLINTHIAFTTPSVLNANIAETEFRKREFKILAEEVYRRVSTKRYGFFIPAYTILLGDYNLCISGPGTKLPRTELTGGNEYSIYEIDRHMKVRTVQSELTSLKEPPKDSTNTAESADYYSQDYDHFTFNNDYTDKMRMSVSRISAVDTYLGDTGNKLVDYHNEISDHVPIKLEINLRKR